ncbi:MAG: hypothetical protein V4487_05200 [Chlamydiota bacterium]
MAVLGTGVIRSSNHDLYNGLVTHLTSTAPHIAKELAAVKGRNLISPDLTKRVIEVISKVPNIKSLNLNADQKKIVVSNLWAKFLGSSFLKAIGGVFAKSKL